MHVIHCAFEFGQRSLPICCSWLIILILPIGCSNRASTKRGERNMTLGRLFAGVIVILIIAATNLTVGAHIKDTYFERLISQSDQVISSALELPPLQAEEPRAECIEKISPNAREKIANTANSIKFSYLS